MMIATLIFGMISCSSDDSNSNEKQNEILLQEHPSITMGWGKGRANYPGYLSLSKGNGQIETFFQIDDNDEQTQGLVDIVFPGDWGSSGGGLTICAPNTSGAGGAAREYCTNWLRKKGTKVYELPSSFDLSSFENTKTVNHILSLNNNASYTDWVNLGIGGGQGKTILVKTYEGYLALIFIQNIQGTYGDVQAKVTLRIKITKEIY